MLKDDVHLDIKQLTDVDGDVKQRRVGKQTDHFVSATCRRQCQWHGSRALTRLLCQLQTRVEQCILPLHVSQLHHLHSTSALVRHVVQLQQHYSVITDDLHHWWQKQTLADMHWNRTDTRTTPLVWLWRYASHHKCCQHTGRRSLTTGSDCCTPLTTAVLRRRSYSDIRSNRSRCFWHATLRLHSAIRQHQPPPRVVLSQICCFGERKVALFQILLDGAEPEGRINVWVRFYLKSVYLWENLNVTTKSTTYLLTWWPETIFT